MDRSVIDETLAALRRKAAVAVLIGMLTIGRHEASMWLVPPPPAVVRVRTVDPAAEAWRALFPSRPAPN
ncbi:MAG: hypothetical protein EA416_13425 [Trueperaceae bacterium]|nr:MAG: hypothetical protein EA416_13425 [Trueperaceae bacterium]